MSRTTRSLPFNSTSARSTIVRIRCHHCIFFVLLRSRKYSSWFVESCAPSDFQGRFDFEG